MNRKQQAVIDYLFEENRVLKDQLQVASHELVGAEGALLFDAAFAVPVAETHGVGAQVFDTLLADGRSADVSGEVFDGCLPPADRAQVDHPWLLPA